MERARSIALSGQFAEAWERVHRSPDLERADQPFLRPEAAVAVANALLPNDPPELIATTLARARRAVLNQPDLEWPQTLWKFNNLIALMDVETQLGRFDEAEELGGHFSLALPTNPGERSNTFNKAARFDAIAEESNRAGHPDRAMRAARRALTWVRDVEDSDTRSYPTIRAIAAMVAAGGDEEAFRVYEATPRGLLMPDSIWSIILDLRKQGKLASARRWAEVELARVRDQLRQVRESKPEPLADPDEEERRRRWMPSDAMLGQWIAHYEALLGDPDQARRVIEGQPADVQAAILKELAVDLAQRGQVAGALALASLAPNLKARREVELAVATNLPAPPRPPAGQPLSDAAR